VPAETPVRFHPAAEEEMFATADWYDERTGGGDDFLDAVENTIDGIAAAPWRWPVAKSVKPATRRRVMSGYQYSIFYRIDDEGVLIVAIAHQSRRPRYWKGR
jgi:toxin ParE1/3/4